MSQKTRNDFMSKVVIIGEPGTGKTSFLHRLCDNEFKDDYICTVGVDFNVKIIKKDNNILRIQLWDTAGQEKFQVMTKNYYKGAKGCIIIYDISRRSSFEKVPFWIKEFKEMNPESNYIIFLAGNKKDLTNDRKVSYEEGRVYAKQSGVLFSEISVKESKETVDSMIEILGLKLIDILIDERMNSKNEIPNKVELAKPIEFKHSNQQCCT